MPNLILRPSGDTTTKTLLPYGSGTANFDRVNESFEDETNGVQTLDNGFPYTGIDLYDFTNHVSESGTINNITIYAKVKNINPAAYDGLLIIKINPYGNFVYDGYHHAISSSWTLFSDVWALNPYTGLAWTWENVDAMRAGIQLSTATTDGKDSYGVMCDWVYCVINYNLPPIIYEDIVFTIYGRTDSVIILNKSH